MPQGSCAMGWNEKLQALKVLKQATEFLKANGALTQQEKKRFCAIAVGLILDGTDGDAEDDWKDLLDAADESETEVVLEEDSPFLAGRG